MNTAITGNLSNLLVVVGVIVRLRGTLADISKMRAVKRFKNLLFKKRPHTMESILGGKDSHFVQPPQSMKSVTGEPYHHARSVDSYDRRPIEGALAVEGVHRDIDLTPSNAHFVNPENTKFAQKPFGRPEGHGTEGHSSPTATKRDLHTDPAAHRGNTSTRHREISHGDDHGKGHAHDPLSDHLFLGLGSGGGDYRPDPDPPVISESPPAADIEIYEHAYHLEVDRIRSTQGQQRTLFLTRRVNDRERYEGDENIVDIARNDSEPQSGVAKLIEKARAKAHKPDRQHKEDSEMSDADPLECKSNITKSPGTASADTWRSTKEHQTKQENSVDRHKPSKPETSAANAVEEAKRQAGKPQEQSEKNKQKVNSYDNDQIRWSEIGEFTHALTAGNQDAPETTKDEKAQEGSSHKRQRSGIDRILELARQKEDDKTKKLGRSSLAEESVHAS